MPLQQQVTAFLQSRHVRVLDEWIVDCLEWLHEEYQGQNVTADMMKEYVYEQWLDSDLSEIASPTLPQGITQQRKTLLNGSYTLQVNVVQDVSQPAYGQLVKLQGKENENVLVSAATQSTQQNKFEAKSSRMLMLQLTDGHQSLQGMEYQPIRQLSDNLMPGTKILVSGSIPCRRGILMLASDNVQILGGEVESLAETNSRLQVLANALGVEGSQATQQTQSQAATALREGTGIPANPTNAQNGMGRHPGPPPSRPTVAEEDGFFSDDLGDDLDAMMLNEIQQIEEMDQIQQQASSAAEETEWPPDEDDIDEMLLEEVERVHFSHPETNQQWTAPRETQTERKSSDKISAPFSGRQEMRVTRELTATSQGRTNQPSSGQAGKLDGRPNFSSSIERSDIQKQGLNVRTQGALIPEDHGSNRSRPGESSQSKSVSVVKRISTTAESNAKSGIRRVSETTADRLEEMRPNGPQVIAVAGIPQASAKTSVAESIRPVPADAKKATGSSPPKPFSQSASSTSFGRDVRTSFPKPVQATAAAPQIIDLTSGRDSAWPSSVLAATSSDREDCPSSSSELDHANIQADEDDSVAAKRRRFRSDEGVGSVSFGGPSFVSLSSVMNRVQSQEAFTFTIKGFVITLLSPLSRNDGRWSITATISDQTASLDVDLSDKVLTGLIGFSVPEMTKIKKTLKASDPATAKELETKLRQGLAQCKESLIDMHCAMTVASGRPEQRPLVTSVGTTDPTERATHIREMSGSS